MTNPGDDDTIPAKMPSITRPFAAFGAAAGLFAILALGAFRAPAREVSPVVPMIVTAAVGALAGRILRSWPRLHAPMRARETVIVNVGIVIALAGMASGGAVGLLTWGLDGVVRFALGGGLVGLLFLPSALVVFDAAKRAGRGRHGLLVAETDRRTVLSTVLAGVAFAGAVQVPALLNVEVSDALEPLAQLALSMIACAGATAAIVVLQRRDLRARAALAAFAQEAPWLDRVDGGAEDEEALAPGAVDLGIGADHWARLADAGYRISGRADVLVKGSIAEATTAFDECTRRRHRSLVVATCGLVAVLVSFVLRLQEFVR